MQEDHQHLLRVHEPGTCLRRQGRSVRFFQTPCLQVTEPLHGSSGANGGQTRRIRLCEQVNIRACTEWLAGWLPRFELSAGVKSHGSRRRRRCWGHSLVLSRGGWEQDPSKSLGPDMDREGGDAGLVGKGSDKLTGAWTCRGGMTDLMTLAAPKTIHASARTRGACRPCFHRRAGSPPGTAEAC